MWIRLLLMVTSLNLCAGSCEEPAREETDTRITSDVADAPFTLGTHPQRASSPDMWRPLGSELDVELGGQGSWMVVLGFRTRAFFSDRVDINAVITLPERELGSLSLTRQRLLPGGDGYDYFYDFFLVVDVFDITVDGREATLTFSVSSEDHTLEETHTVILRGGP